eukprot:scaffold1061_cov213-Prasinococcus_capsulatus_cf.AAC.5
MRGSSTGGAPILPHGLIGRPKLGDRSEDWHGSAVASLIRRPACSQPCTFIPGSIHPILTLRQRCVVPRHGGALALAQSANGLGGAARCGAIATASRAGCYQR